MRVRSAHIQLTPNRAQESMMGACVQAARDQRVESDDGGRAVSIAEENIKETSRCLY